MINPPTPTAEEREQDIKWILEELVYDARAYDDKPAELAARFIDQHPEILRNTEQEGEREAAFLRVQAFITRFDVERTYPEALADLTLLRPAQPSISELRELADRMKILWPVPAQELRALLEGDK